MKSNINNVDLIEGIFPKSSKPLVFLPFYGEYGLYILWYLRFVHYAKAPLKIVCCRRGDEILFPSATSFFYEWQDPFLDSAKCGLRDVYSFGEPSARFESENKLIVKLNKIYSHAYLVELQYPIPFEKVSKYPVELTPQSGSAPSVDVAICARRRLSRCPEGDHGRRNFQHWSNVIYELKSCGLTVGQIGQKDTSFKLAHTCVSSWNFPNNTSAMLDILQKCRIYLGTDTGPTHLAAITKTPIIAFRNPSDSSYNLLRKCVLTVTKAQGSYFKQISNCWNNPNKIARCIIKFISDCRRMDKVKPSCSSNAPSKGFQQPTENGHFV